MRTIVKKTPITKEQYLAGVTNTAKHLFPDLRQKSKTVTFALQYAGTPYTLQQNSGFPWEEAQLVFDRYHTLYKESDAFAETKKTEAARVGYVDVAFGLRIRTPLLKQVIYGSSSMPYEAQAEGRTLGNALSQSYGLLNNRAAVAFMQKVWDSPYRLKIHPVGLIHDCIYLLVKDDAEVVAWVNEHLIQEMKWQELPEIQHPVVKLGAQLDIFWPNWSSPITLPNDASIETIRSICEAAKLEIEGKVSEKV